MSTRRKAALLIIAGLLALTLGSLLGLSNHSEESAARQKLDNLLGQADTLPFAENRPSEHIPLEAPNLQAPPENPNNTPNATEPLGSDPLASEPPGFLGLPIPNPLAGNVPDSGVDVQEYAANYVLRIPLTDPVDARNVKVNVTPHHIEVSGKIGRREQGVSFSSSFMQSFSTSQAVLPDKVTQAIQKTGSKTDLVITVPKQHPGQGNSKLEPPPAPEAPGAPNAPQAPQGLLQDDSNTGHRVI